MRAARPWLTALLLASILAPFANLGIAIADCAADLRIHLSASINAYKEWEIHHEPIDSYGYAAWGHFEDQLNWVRDHSDMPNCNDEAFEIPYYRYRTKADRFDIMADSKRHQPGMRLAAGQSSDYYRTYIMNSWLDRYYNDVSILYDLGYAKENPGEYAEFKQDVIRWFARMHRRFTSWENTRAHSPLPPIKAHRACVMPDRPPSIANAAQAEYPDLERTVGMGYFIVKVAVIIGRAGNVLKTTVLRSSSNVLIDGAAIQAARMSTYAPAIRDCKPVTASYIFRADLSP